MPTTTKPMPGLRRVARSPSVLADPNVRRNIRACLDGGIPAVDVAVVVGCCAEVVVFVAEADR